MRTHEREVRNGTLIRHFSNFSRRFKCLAMFQPPPGELTLRMSALSTSQFSDLRLRLSLIGHLVLSAVRQ